MPVWVIVFEGVLFGVLVLLGVLKEVTEAVPDGVLVLLEVSVGVLLGV